MLHRQREIDRQEGGVRDLAGRARQDLGEVRGLREQALDLGRAVADHGVRLGLLLDVCGDPGQQHLLGVAHRVDPLLGGPLVGVVVVAGERRRGEARRALLGAGARLGGVGDDAVGGLEGQLDGGVPRQAEERGVAEDRVVEPDLLDEVRVSRLGHDVAAVCVGRAQGGVEDLARLQVVAEVRHRLVGAARRGAAHVLAAGHDLAQLRDLGVLHLGGLVLEGLDAAHEAHELVAPVGRDVPVCVLDLVDGEDLRLQG